MEEVFLDYIYNYQISNYGNIRNKITYKILKQHVNKGGYMGVCVSLGCRNKKKLIRTHRAVAERFIPNPNNYPQVNHIDGNKMNNSVNNLEWCSNSYNTQHAYDKGLKRAISGADNPQAKLRQKDVDYIRNTYSAWDKKFGARALARKFGVSHVHILRIIKKEKWK